MARPRRVLPKETYKQYRRYYQRIVPLFRRPATRAYMGFILTLFTVSFFALFAIRPTANTIVELLRKIDDGKYTNKKLAEKITALSAAQNTYFELIDDVGVVDDALPNEAAIDSYVKQLENMILASRLKILTTRIDRFRLNDKRGGDDKTLVTEFIPAEGVRVGIAAEGSFEEVSDLLEKIHLIRRITTIEAINISSTSEEENKLMVSIQAKTYYFKE